MKRMKQWMGIILTIMLMVGSMQMPVYAEDMKRDAFEAVDLDNTDITETAEEESMLLSEGESSEEADIEEGTMDDSISEDRIRMILFDEIGLEQESISLSEEEENIEEDSATTESSYENSEDRSFWRRQKKRLPLKKQSALMKRRRKLVTRLHLTIAGIMPHSCWMLMRHTER